MDLEAYEEALDWFKKVLDLELKVGRSEAKLCHTRVLIFEAKCRSKNVPKAIIENEFDSLISQIPAERTSLKLVLHEAMSLFLSERGDHETACVLLQRSKEFNVEDINESGDEESSDISDDLDSKSDRTILSDCMEMAHQRNSDIEIEKDRDKEKNAHGETRLHIAARSTNILMVEKLIAAGYDVNKRDYGGWTPISEAVSAGIRENVCALLKAGAYVDPVSKEALNDDEHSTGGGITPLMEACEKGFVDIARDLLKHGASVVKRNADESFPVRGFAPQQHKPQKALSHTNCIRQKRRKFEDNVDLNSYKRIISGLGAQSKKKEKQMLFCEERTLDLMHDDLTFEPPVENEIVLPSDCDEEQDFVVNNVNNENDFHQNHASSSSLSHSKAKENNAFSSFDDVVNSVATREWRGRKRGNQDFSESVSVQIKKRSHQARIDSDVGCSFDEKATLKPAPSSSEPHAVVTLKFENDYGEILKADKVVSFPRTATIAAVRERFISELAAYKSKPFDICLSDGREVDVDVPLLSLGESLIVVCPLIRSDVLKCVVNFDSTGVLDLSSISKYDQDLVEDVLKVVAEIDRSVIRLVLDGCNISPVALSTIAGIFPHVQEYSCKYVGVLDEHLTVLCPGSSSLSVSSLDLSHNELTSGLPLSTFLASCSNLKELRLCDLELTFCEEAVVACLCGLKNLQLLDISFSGLLRGQLVERLLSSCDNLVKLRIDGCDLSGIAFTSNWLPNLRELSMVGCQLTEFDSLIEWISMGCIQLVDLSATGITIDHLRTLVDARLICPPITIRLIRCPGVECDAQAFADMILHFIHQRSFPIRFCFSPSFSNTLQAITAFASNFLCT
ncbi:leucine Rich repeat-containing domain protein [Dictyocaulus viviparus]|uniref:Leucine Rich repeat-containing domain protein n=1 Tax=Dictyocaulus viviparus TaxID=29172 RepID=A0A0D8XYT7_DICVI|nr:leucine Rich repeat-containing domain protein [Dictyocaulus viviparus]